MRKSIIYRGLWFVFSYKESDQVQGDFEIFDIILSYVSLDGEEILEAYRTDFDKECNKLIKEKWNN